VARPNWEKSPFPIGDFDNEIAKTNLNDEKKKGKGDS